MQFESNPPTLDVEITHLLQARLLDAIMSVEAHPQPWSGDELQRVLEERLSAIVSEALDAAHGTIRSALVDVRVKPDETARYRRVAEVSVQWGRAGEPGHWGWRHRLGRALIS